jgi:large subunit ribosomal protein L22
MPGPKTNEREGTRAVLHHAGMSAYKAREVIDIIRGRPVHEAADLLNFVERGCGVVIGKLLQSAVANASNNDGLDPDELFVSACYVDEGPTAKRWRPRARGRATRIRKRSSHITIIVSRMPDNQLARLQARRRQENLTMRARRVEATRRSRAEGTESAEATSRRERRHPETIVPPETETEVVDVNEDEATGVEAVADQVTAVDQDEVGGEQTEDEAEGPEVGEVPGSGSGTATGDQEKDG